MIAKVLKSICEDCYIFESNTCNILRGDSIFNCIERKLNEMQDGYINLDDVLFTLKVTEMILR